MPVKIKCSNCEKVLVAPDAARGKAVKCPACQTRIAVPAAPVKTKPKKPAGPADSEEALANLDMSRVADANARICVKCGHDMQFQEEEETECANCGFDSAVGGMGAKARKKAMKGPDPADFYPGLIAEAMKFTSKNYILAWRTVAYTLVSLLVTIGLGFLYLYLSMWPTRCFLALCFTLSFLVIPGWMWFLDTEIIKLTLERKDKFKKINFDFFLSSALGTASVLWCCFFVGPLVFVPWILSYFFVGRVGGNNAVVLPICIAMAFVPAIWMLPIVMANMSMPVQYKGWMIWKIFPLAYKNVKPLMYWMLWFVLTNIPHIAGVATIAAVYGKDIVNTVQTMEFNADIYRKRDAAIVNPNTRKKGQAAPAPLKLETPREYSLKPFIVPTVILCAMCVVNGFTSMFNMRTNGQFVYYHKSSLDLVDKRKDYKYIAKEKKDEDADDKPRTLKQMLVDSAVFFLVFDIFGFIGGMLYGASLTSGKSEAIFYGVLIGHQFSMIGLFGQCVRFAFHTSLLWAAITFFTYPIGFFVYCFKDWEDRKEIFIKTAMGWGISIILGIVQLIMLIAAMTPEPLPVVPQAEVGQEAKSQVREEGQAGEVSNQNKAEVMDLQNNAPSTTPANEPAATPAP